MTFIKHAFEWGYGYGILALFLGLAYMPLIPVVYAGNYMTATMLVNMAESEDVSRRAKEGSYASTKT